LNKLRLSHDIVLIGTRTVRGRGGNYNPYMSTNVNDNDKDNNNTVPVSSSSLLPSMPSYLSNSDGWNKMVTHRITLEKGLEGSKEEEDGFGFVALMLSQCVGDRSNVMNVMHGTNVTNVEWKNVVPFSVTADGIKC
jgi:hypothetical protein